MVAYTFTPIKVKAQVKVTCSHEGCKKKVQRTKIFEQTLNPYNRDSEGNVKTEQQIRSELSSRRTEWINNNKTLFCKEHA